MTGFVFVAGFSYVRVGCRLCWLLFWKIVLVSHRPIPPSASCWLSCAACPVGLVCPVLRVFSAVCASSFCVVWVCGVGVFLFLFLFPCSPDPSVTLRRREAQEAQQRSKHPGPLSFSLSLVVSCLVVHASCRLVPFLMLSVFVCLCMVWRLRS